MTRPALLAALVVASCAEPDTRIYDNNDLRLVTAYTAKEACSCRFVMEQTEAYCRAWTKANPAIADLSFDGEAKMAVASAILFWDATARFVDEKTGCVLE